MEKVPKTGHAINVANLELLIAYCVSMGVVYNPSNQTLIIGNLSIKLHLSQAKMQLVKDTFTAHNTATNARADEFKDLKQFCTRLINALIACGASKKTIANARTIVRKIQGKRADNSVIIVINEEVKPLSETEKIIKRISVSQQGFDSLLDNFIKLFTLLSAEPKYNPNEIDLTLDAISAKIAALTTVNTLVKKLTPPYTNSLTSCDTELYSEITGMVDTALLVKSYILSVLKASSKDYKTVNAIHFKNF